MSPPPLREGDVVWARQKGYPWWPAVLSPAPASPGLGLWQTGQGKKIKYHCTFLAWNKERCWLEGAVVRRFEREDVGERRRKEYRVKLKHFKDSHLEAIDLGLEILDDPGNPMDHLVKEMEVVVEEDQEVGTEDVKAEKSRSNVEGAKAIQSKSSKMLVKKEKSAGVNKETNKNINARLEVEHNAKVNEETEESFFQTIAEKVKNPRNRKSVEKFNHPDENNEGKIGKIKKFLSKQQPPVPSSSAAPRSPMRCQCAGCLLADCGQCRFCLDRVCFGGEGKLRQICSRRMCVASSKGGGVGMVEWNVDVGTRVIATTENDKDEKNYVFEDQEMKIANKERKARIIDIQSEAESGDDETPLVINFDNIADDSNNNANASNQDPRDLPSPTHDELPTSSSISYSKSVDEKLVASDNSVWDDVKHSLLDVEDSLLMEVSDSLANEFEITTHSPVLHSSPSSHHSQASSSSITISTPSQSPVRELCFANEAEEIVEGTGVYKDNLENVVEPKFVDKSRSEPMATVENVYFHEDDLEVIIDDNIIKEDHKVCGKVIHNDLESKVEHDEIEITTSLKSKSAKHKDKRVHQSKSQQRSKKKSVKVSSIIDDTIVVPKEVADIEAPKSKESLKKVTEINMFTGNEIKKSEKKKARNDRKARSKMRSSGKDQDMKKEYEESKVGSATRAPKEKREAKDFQDKDANSNYTSEKSKHKGEAKSSVLASGLSLPVKESSQVDDGEGLPHKNKLKQVFQHKTSESKFEDVPKDKKVKDVKTRKKDDVKAKKVIKLKKEGCEIDSTRNEAKGTPHEASKLLGSFKIPKSIPKTKQVKKEEDVSVTLKEEKSCQDSTSVKSSRKEETRKN
eukprot:GFUD01022571.1.p1 GENE.GFUD01022571.1~~GFUD01022571.1.p1  ORF type:complete len:854 (+),score=276.59 GFUD01022571.1:131-2692(+)